MTTTIFVFLPNEAGDTWRPVEAEVVRPGAFRIVTQDPDPADEVWEFKSGDVVREERIRDGSQGVVVGIARVVEP